MAPRKKELPLEGPRWIRVANSHQALAARFGDLLAAKDMTEKLEDGSLPCMKRRFGNYPPGPERELVLTEFWRGHRVAHLSDGAYVVNHGGGQIFTDRYVWGPRAAELWPNVFSPAAPAALDPPPSHRKRGPKADWQSVAMRELVRRGLETTTAKALCEICQDTTGDLPEVSAMNRFLRRILRK
jgi:hypothetical protein